MREHDGDNHIVIRWWAGPVLVAVYALYVVVAASYDSILAKLGAAPAPRAELPPPEGADDRPLALGRRSSLIYEDEPAANFTTPAPSEEIDGSYGAVSNPLHEDACCEDVDESFGSTESLSPSLRRRKTSILRAFNEESRHLINRFGLLRFARDEAHFGDVEERDGVFGCYLFKANKFYLSCRASTHAWELRWLRISPGEVCLYRKRDDVDAKPFWTPSGPSRYALRGVTVADAPRHVLALDLAPIYTAAGGREPDALGSFDDESLSEPVAMRAFMLSPNGAVFDAALARLTAATDAACQVVPLRRRASVFIDGHAPTDEMEPSLIEWPEDATCLGVALHVALLPIKWLLHATITDVRTDPGLAKDQAPAACLECVAWLVVLSLAMVWCCETLGALLGLPDSVVGLTLSAIGTSLPNLFASISVARRGLGNMAVSNALGSNSFNIYIGLGLPWLIYTAAIGPYHSLPADDIVGPVLVLVVTLLAFLVLLACTGFRLRRGHGVVFLALYLAFLVWAVAKEY